MTPQVAMIVLAIAAAIVAMLLAESKGYWR